MKRDMRKAGGFSGMRAASRSRVRRLGALLAGWLGALPGVSLTALLAVLSIALAAAVLAASGLPGSRAAASPAAPAGYANLGRDAGDYLPVTRGSPLVFPADHGPHDGYRIEWWYVTANLKDEDGHDWGVQWTLFRSALRPGRERAGWESPNVWMAHAALTDAAAHQFAEKFARGGIGQAGVRLQAPPGPRQLAQAAPQSPAGPQAQTPAWPDARQEPPSLAGPGDSAQAPSFDAWIDDWSLRGTDIDRLTMQARGKDFRYRLNLAADGPLVLHGDGGYSEKSGQGQASYYYSQPFYRVDGEVERAGKVHRVQGRAWLDREWSSQPLSADQRGWDWFSLHLASGANVMLFQVRQANGKPYRAGTWIGADGRAVALRAAQIQLDPLAWSRQDDGRKVPTRWRVRIAGVAGGGVDTSAAPGLNVGVDADADVDVTADALQPKAWMGTAFPYWEGPVGLSAGGVGYLEMTGY